jgi:hypothetical protein
MKIKGGAQYVVSAISLMEIKLGRQIENSLRLSIDVEIQFQIR